MSKMKFSDDQELAISALNENYLISAGAGSGKTAVLTERIYRIAKADNSLDKFLVLTFTNLAAAEMKDRVRGKLLDDPETLGLASEVDNAHIETFDSFSLFLAKKYFYELGISKDISIVENSILSIKRKVYLDEIFEELYEKEDSRFLSLIDNYASKNENGIKEFIINILQTGDKKADNFAFFNSLKTDYFNQEFIDLSIKEYVDEIKSNLEFVRQNAYELEDADDADQIINFIDGFLAINDYDELYSKLSDSVLNKFPTKTRTKTSDGDFRKKLADFYNKKIKVTDDSDYGNKETITRQYLGTKPFVETMVDIVIEVEMRLNEFKKAHNAFSFGDISRFVLKLLQNEEIRKEISDSFDYIMVDEYQDTNDIQETVISAIARDNVYMVGDVKQSIYRFRGADCHIFQEKYEKYKKKIGGKEIDLNTSYRSRSEVVNFINHLFKDLMKKEFNAIDYSNGHEFKFGREEYEENKPACSYEPDVYSYFYEKGDKLAEIESNIILNDITNKINEEYQVYDNKLKGSRKCTFKDFSIIIDRGSEFDTYRREFAKANIPLKVESKETLFSSDVAMVIKNLVKMLYYSLNSDYSSQYKHAFMSIARSFLFEYRDDDLYEIYKNKGFLKEEFAQRIELIKEKLRYASIKEILLTLYEKFDIYASICRITQYYANTHKLEHLLTIAESMDVLNYSLSDFVNYFDDLDKMKEDIDYSDSDSQEDSVTLINIHKSKGLEYPIVYYPGLSKAFNRMDLYTSFLLSNKYGAVLPSSTEESSSLFIHLVREELKNSDFEEKIRLLYVALTRAKEKIILLNPRKENEIKFFKPNNSRCMSDLLSLSDVLTKFDRDYRFEGSKIDRADTERIVNKVQLKKIEVKAEEVVHLRASKSLSDDVDESVLDFGTELHSYLEHMDLNTRNLDYINNRQMRRYVYNVMNSSLFSDITNEQVRHEFRFFDSEENIEGYIDALIIKENEIDIVDFKLKNIDEEEYDRQLRIYKKCLLKKTNLPIKMYLLAAITGEIREVKDE